MHGSTPPAHDEPPQARTRRDAEAAAHTKAECALREHPTLGRYLRQVKSVRLRIDRGAIAAEERLDGKYLLSTSDPDLPAADVALGYKNLLAAERVPGPEVHAGAAAGVPPAGPPHPRPRAAVLARAAARARRGACDRADLAADQHRSAGSTRSPSRPTRVR